MPVLFWRGLLAAHVGLASLSRTQNLHMILLCLCRWIPAAAMTRSTRRLRKRLTAAGIEFKMPLDPAGDRRDAQVSERTKVDTE